VIVGVAVGVSEGSGVSVEDGVADGTVAVAVDDGLAVGVRVGSEAIASDCDPLKAAAVAQAVTATAMSASSRFNSAARVTERDRCRALMGWA
jgi:hypothetical protein